MDDLEEQFSFQLVSAGAAIRVCIENAYLADWNPLLSFYNKHSKKGIVDWEIDLRKAGQISSSGLGALVAFNTKCVLATGSFKVIVHADSHIRKMLFLTKLDQIIAIEKDSESDLEQAAKINAVATQHSETLAKKSAVEVKSQQNQLSLRREKMAEDLLSN